MHQRPVADRAKLTLPGTPVFKAQAGYVACSILPVGWELHNADFAIHPPADRLPPVAAAVRAPSQFVTVHGPDGSNEGVGRPAK